MPKTTREWAKRKLVQSSNNLDWCGTHIAEVIVIYAPEHPEIAAPLAQCQLILEELQKAIDKTGASF